MLRAPTGKNKVNRKTKRQLQVGQQEKRSARAGEWRGRVKQDGCRRLDAPGVQAKKDGLACWLALWLAALREEMRCATRQD